MQINTQIFKRIIFIKKQSGVGHRTVLVLEVWGTKPVKSYNAI